MISKTDIDAAAHCDLVHFCVSRGIEVKREGREYFLKDYDSLYISAAMPWKWYRFSTHEGGKAIDFCIKFLGLSFRQAVFELLSSAGRCPELPEQESKRVAPSSVASSSVALTFDAASDARRVIAYLCKKRGIDYSIVKGLLKSGKLYQDGFGNASFVISDFDANRIGAEKHGTGSSRFKRLTVQNGFGFSLSRSLDSSPERICFFESAIDLISFYQIYQGALFSVLLVSMGGLKPVVIYNYLSYYSGVVPFLMIDHDDVGHAFSQRMRMQTRYVPHGKDWNDYLRYLQSTTPT